MQYQEKQLKLAGWLKDAGEGLPTYTLGEKVATIHYGATNVLIVEKGRETNLSETEFERRCMKKQKGRVNGHADQHEFKPRTKARNGKTARDRLSGAQARGVENRAKRRQENYDRAMGKNSNSPKKSKEQKKRA